MAQINYNLKVRRKNMRCAKFECDMAKAFAEMFDELGIDYAYGKLREKINRIKALRKQPNMVENEGLEDALLDTAGYAILTLVELKKKKGNGI